MINNADNFKKGSNRVIESHVRKIMSYVIDCYYLTIKDGKKYDYLKRGKIKNENFLRNGLVEDYMRKNTHLINNGVNEYIIINKEATEPYQDSKCLENHDDPIDIKIEYSPIKNDLKDYSVYFAIECKRITKNSDANGYVGDTVKFSERIYKEKRLPFEGQIGFIENPKISHSSICPIVNKKLKSLKNLTTIKELEATKFKFDFEGSYRSLHEKSNIGKDKFSVFHLFFNYSNIVINN